MSDESNKITVEGALEKLVKIADAMDKDKNELSPEISQILDALIVKHKDDLPDDSWDDVWSMFEDIREHAKNNGEVINEDVPHQLRLGWHCISTNKTWTIRIADFKKSALLREGGDILLRAITSVQGKENLTASLNSKK